MSFKTFTVFKDEAGDMTKAVYDANDDGIIDAGLPTDHDLGGSAHLADTLANVNTKIIGDTLLGVGDFAFASDSGGAQAIALADTYQDLDFLTNEDLDGWTHVVDTADFICPVNGGYECACVVRVEKTGGGAEDADLRALFNGVEVFGSQAGTRITTSNEPKELTSVFRFAGVATQVLKLQISGSDTKVQAATGPTPGGATTPIIASIAVRRLN